MKYLIKSKPCSPAPRFRLSIPAGPGRGPQYRVSSSQGGSRGSLKKTDVRTHSCHSQNAPHCRKPGACGSPGHSSLNTGAWRESKPGFTCGELWHSPILSLSFFKRIPSTHVGPIPGDPDKVTRVVVTGLRVRGSDLVCAEHVMDLVLQLVHTLHGPSPMARPAGLTALRKQNANNLVVYHLGFLGSKIIVGVCAKHLFVNRLIHGECPLGVYPILLHDARDIECKYSFWECTYTAILHGCRQRAVKGQLNEAE